MRTTESTVRARRWILVAVCAATCFVAIGSGAIAEQPRPHGSPAATAPTAAAASPTATAANPAAPQPPPATLSAAERSLWQTEEAFAASFAARDPERFAAFLADDAVFNGASVLRGKAAIRAAWTTMMTRGPVPPFSWRPTIALVTGDLGMTHGPVYDPSGKWVGGFHSTWKRQGDGSWRIVLDSGAPPCGEPEPPTP